MKRLILALAVMAGSGFAPPASAQPAKLDTSTILTSIDGATLRIAINTIGASAAPLDDEENTLRIAYPDNIRAIARRMACIDAQRTAGEECKGLILLGYFSRPEGLSAIHQQAVITRFGLEHNLASVVVNREGEHVVKAYVIFDGGITLENLIVRLSLFGESVKAYQAMLYEAPAGD